MGSDMFVSSAEYAGEVAALVKYCGIKDRCARDLGRYVSFLILMDIVTDPELPAPSFQKSHDDRNTEAPDTSGWSAAQYNRSAAFVYSKNFTAPVLDLLAAQNGERIIDFGCGSGEVTTQIGELVGKDGMIVGVDASESMV